DGDAYLRVQRVADGPGGSHLDLHVDDLGGFAAQAVAMGAIEEHRYDDLVVLRSPAGLSVCVVGHDGEGVRPVPQPIGDTGEQHLLDQISIDIPRSQFDEECAFWSDLTGWERRRSTVRAEFDHLARPPGMPLRLLLQRREDEGPARAHLDVASTDVEVAVAHHLTLGATLAATFPHWTVMLDPSGIAYCVTSRNPATGQISNAV
ncbi:MAG TPA: VOC family protein, partial [Euzebya sp.]|nr:VOC family protein [Euzebya sp.]